MVGVTRDVTREREADREREELLRQARDARDDAEHQVRLKDEFLATLSHELRTPMNAMLGWLAIIEGEGDVPGEIKKPLEIIERNARAQAKLIEDLLDMNRLMTGNVQLELDAVDLAHLAESTVQTLRPTADAKSVRLAVEAQNTSGLVNGDGRRLQQVLWNLVHNAVKFTPAGGHVTVGVRRSDDTVRLVVTDSGCGISPEFLPHVFERFRQEDPSSTRQAHGLGLGLSISRHLAELHGGTIRATSTGAGHGATFVLELPRAGSGSPVAVPSEPTDAER